MNAGEWTRQLYQRKDLLWLVLWVGGLTLLIFWDIAFLNAPAFARIQTAFVNSFLTGIMVVTFSFALGWGVGISLHLLESRRSVTLFAVASLAVDAVRSIPQILIVLIGYVVLNALLYEEIIASTFMQLLWIACVIAVAVFLEVTDAVAARIEHFRRLDFVDAMLCCGISEIRIINVEILWKNSRSHLLHKLIAVFGVSIFLQCSIDFIISVGLSTDVSLSNFPVTLGSLLATLDSKQDILAISTLFRDPGYLSVMFVRHLQGLSVAFCIVFTLLSIYNIGNGFARRLHLA